MRRSWLPLLLLAAFLSAALLTAVPSAYANSSSPASTLRSRLGTVGTQAGFRTAVPETGLAQYVGRIINVAMSLLGIIFVAQIVYAGYLWMTATGEEEQVTRAKHIIRRSIIGLAIVLSAWAITSFVVGYLVGAAA